MSRSSSRGSAQAHPDRFGGLPPGCPDPLKNRRLAGSPANKPTPGNAKSDQKPQPPKHPGHEGIREGNVLVLRRADIGTVTPSGTSRAYVHDSHRQQPDRNRGSSRPPRDETFAMNRF